MKGTDVRQLLPWIASIAFSLAIGVGAGWFFAYANGVGHPISKAPIPLDFCFGWPIQTFSEVSRFKLRQSTRRDGGRAIDKKDCENLDITNHWAQTEDPVRNAWEQDLERNFYTAQFQLSSVGTIPAYPGYLTGLQTHGIVWHTMHKVTRVCSSHIERTGQFISVLRLQDCRSLGGV